MNSPDRTEASDSRIANEIAALHDECEKQLLRLAWAIVRDWELAADAVQETFALLAKKFGEVEAAHRRGWLVKTVQFQALNLRRSRVRATQLIERIREAPTAYAVSTESSNVEMAEQIDALRSAIDALPAEQREVVLMRLADEKGFAEIAETLNLPLGTVLSRMRLALEKLRKRMPNDEP